MLPALFPAITMIAHALEDYIETAGKVGPDHLPAIQAYTDAIRVIADHGENPGDSETDPEALGLPAGARVAREGCKFQMDMTNHLIKLGVFGNIKD